jgi:predicted RNA binding protein YcfA (HicA-like mRNA interferase family)
MSLGKLSFEKTSQKGSHAKFTKNGNPTKVVIIPMHNEIVKGTLKSILEQAGLTLEEFLENL